MSNFLAYGKFPRRPQLRRPVDRSKDQTYYRAAIREASLRRALFPIAPYKKTEVREMAHIWGLPTASREESMGICFVGEKRKFDDFIGILDHQPFTIPTLLIGGYIHRSSIHPAKARTHHRLRDGQDCWQTPGSLFVNRRSEREGQGHATKDACCKEGPQAEHDLRRSWIVCSIQSP